MRCSPVALSIVRGPGLEVPPQLAARWNELPAPIRSYLSSFLARDATPVGRVSMPSAAREPVPSTFVDDLVSGGPRLRAAFPGLVRRLASIDGGAIRIACEGIHDGAFFDFMLPTRRRVRFDELHELALRGEVVDDRVSIDVRAIVRQLVAG